MNMDLIVRKAQLKDAAGIAKVQVEAWQSAYKGEIPDSYLDSLSVEKRTERWHDILSKPEDNADTIVAEVDGKIVGFCSVSHCRDTDILNSTGELWAIYVDKDYAGKGVGTAIHNKGLNILKNKKFTHATLWVLTSNNKARKWYEARGWRVEGKTKSDKRDGFSLEETRYIINL
jgi:ribosomal protein S18 acetylase RimI-like enzyme